MAEIFKLLDYAKSIDNPVLLFGVCAIIGFLLWQKFTDSEYNKGKKNYIELESMNRLQIDENRRLREEIEKLRKKFDDLQERCENQAREIEEFQSELNDLTKKHD